MCMRAGRWVAAMGLVPFLCAAAPPPSAWVPVRWPWTDTRSLELLAGTPVNCLLLKSPTSQLVAAAQARGVVALAVVTPGGEGREVERALAAKVDGIVLEGEFPEGTAAGPQSLLPVQAVLHPRRYAFSAPVVAVIRTLWWLQLGGIILSLALAFGGLRKLAADAIRNACFLWACLAITLPPGVYDDPSAGPRILAPFAAVSISGRGPLGPPAAPAGDTARPGLN